MSEEEAFEQWLAKRRFMVVEDDTSSRLLVSGLLRSIGAGHVDIAVHGQEALDKMKSKGYPDVMFCDWNMPTMDGLTLLSLVKGLFPDIKFIMVTANKEPEQVRSAAHLKVDGYIVKPFSRQTLIDSLERLRANQKP